MQEFEFNYKEYKKRISNKFSGKSIVVYIFICIILMGAVFFLKPKAKNKNCKLYFVEINCFLNYSQANELANEIRNKGGAGYIYFDEKYHVFANLYLTEQDANSVCNNLKAEYPTIKTFSIEFNKNVNYNNLNSNQAHALKNFVEVGQNCILEIYNNILSFDKAEIDQTKLILNFKQTETKFLTCCNDFNSAFNSNSKFNKAKTYVADLTTCLKNLTSENNSAWNFKFEMIKFGINFANTLSCF